MDSTKLKADTITLMEKRGAIEAEMNTIVQRFCQPGGPGLSGNLLDSEGFPRSDIDIPAIRAERHRLAELKNDHKDLTEKINQNLQLLHAATAPRSLTIMNPENCKETDTQVSSPFHGCVSSHVGASNAVDEDVKLPFAMVDEIAEASPAAEDGLQLGDQIVKFGNVESGDNLLSRLASQVQINQGSPISVVIIRQGTSMSLSVTPRTWQGRGLLGCHFKIL